MEKVGNRLILNKLGVVPLALVLLCVAGATRAHDPQPGSLPLALPFLPGQARTQPNLPPNTMLPPLSREAKGQWARLFMLFSPLSVRDLLNVMAHKMPARPGLTVDQVAASLIARAARHGFMLVDRYPMWKALEARTGQSGTPKVEVISLCDPLVSRDWMDYAPEMALFVPPRIALVEDREGVIWLIMLDWDMAWLDSAGPGAFDAKLRAQGLERREMLEDILRAGAAGEP
jgi:uncharacterized protein (DUF302 family)